MTTVDHAPARFELPQEPTLPVPRGPRTEHLLAHLQHPVHDPGPLPPAEDDPVDGEDTPLALHLLYELHYRSFDGVDERWEWEPGALRIRRELEQELENRLVELAGPPPVGVTPDDVTAELDRIVATEGGPSLSAWVSERGRSTHLREFAVHRSIYQLREADAHTFGIPRLRGQAKAALVEIQRGEYGDGRPEDVHATMFATTMRALGLDDRYGAYLDHVPGVTLSTCNLVDLFGLHRRWRGALAGHLALFEMCSVGPMGRYAAAARRLGAGEDGARFYDAHVEADEHHQVVGRDDLAAALARDEPLVAGEIVFGARALDAVEARFAASVLRSWESARTSLRLPIDAG